MTTMNATQLTARGALLVSLVSLGLTAWALGCDRQPETAVGGPASVEATASVPRPTEESKVAPQGATKSELANPEPKKPEAQTSSRLGKASRSESPAGSIAPPKLKRLVVTTGVEDREPVADKPLRAGEEPIYAFVELQNPTPTDQFVVVTFERGDGTESVGYIKLKVPAKQPRWRTWGRTRMINDAGPWVAVVRTVDGRELARERFDVQAS